MFHNNEHKFKQKELREISHVLLYLTRKYFFSKEANTSSSEPTEKKVKLADPAPSNEVEKCKQPISPSVNNTSTRQVVQPEQSQHNFPGPSKEILPTNASFGTSSIFKDDVVNSPNKLKESELSTPVRETPNEFANFKVSLIPLIFYLNILQVHLILS